jgi:hypothetical protein
MARKDQLMQKPNFDAPSMPTAAISGKVETLSKRRFDTFATFADGGQKTRKRHVGRARRAQPLAPLLPHLMKERTPMFSDEGAPTVYKQVSGLRPCSTRCHWTTHRLHAVLR